MSEGYHEENLILCTETYLREVVDQDLEKPVEVLSACEMLLPIAEDVCIANRCVYDIDRNACKEQSVSGLSRLNCEGESTELKDRCLERWVEDLSLPRIDFYHIVISAMGNSGVRLDSIITSLMHYAQVFFKGIGKLQIWNPTRTDTSTVVVYQSVTVETIVNLLPTEKRSSILLNFPLGTLRMATMVDATLTCRLELERRIAFLYGIWFHLMICLYQKSSLVIPCLMLMLSVGYWYISYSELKRKVMMIVGMNQKASAHQVSFVLKVGRLIDAYLAEIARPLSVSNKIHCYD